MVNTKTERTPSALVLAKHPNAFVHDDGQWVYIKLRENETVICSECGQAHTREKNIHHMSTIGSAGSSAYAWEAAARSLGLM